MKKGTTNPLLKELLFKMKKTKSEGWKTVAEKLETPKRKRKNVNIEKINKYSKEGDVIVVPGKVTSTGELGHKITISALGFSEKAIEKLKKAGAIIKTFEELMKENPKFSKIKIIQ